MFFIPKGDYRIYIKICRILNFFYKQTLNINPNAIKVFYFLGTTLNLIILFNLITSLLNSASFSTVEAEAMHHD